MSRETVIDRLNHNGDMRYKHSLRRSYCSASWKVRSPLKAFCENTDSAKRPVLPDEPF